MKNNHNSSISGFILMILSGWNSFCLLLTVFKRVVYKHQMSCCGWSSLTASVCRGRRSRTPPPLEAPPGGEWHRTRMGCVCRCGTPCGCTDRSPPARLRKAYSPRSPRRCPRHSSPHGSFSERDVENLRKMLYECSLRSVTSSMHDVKKKRYHNIFTLQLHRKVYILDISCGPHATAVQVWPFFATRQHASIRKGSWG